MTTPRQALEALSLVMMTGLPGTHFLGVVVAVVLLVAMLFLWVVLFIREALIYLVVVFAAAFAWPALVFRAAARHGEEGRWSCWRR